MFTDCLLVSIAGFFLTVTNKYMTSIKYKSKKRIGVIAHEDNRIELIDWAYHHKRVLMQHDLVATETISNILEGVINAPVSKLLSTPLTSHQQLALMLAEAKLDIIIFLSDPLVPGVFQKDNKDLLELAVSSNIIIAANRRTADFILNSVLLDSDNVLEVAVPEIYSKSA